MPLVVMAVVKAPRAVLLKQKVELRIQRQLR
jgi:hypothetical protein